MRKKNDFYLVMGAPLSIYPEPPNDQPGCELQDCPKCKKPMWVSFKKRQLLAEYKGVKGKEFYLACYICTYKNGREIFKDADFKMMQL